MRGRDRLNPAGGGAPPPAQITAASGRFPELSVPTPDVQASLAFYRKLGFSLAEVGEARRHPYAVATDGRLCIGLHQLEDFAPALTFVKPDLLKHLDRFEQLGVEFEIRRLGADVFNELGWRDPGGNAVRFVEARTFSPSKRSPAEQSSCGYFREIGLPASDATGSKAHWERIGFVGMDDNGGLGPHVGCTSDTVDVGLYDPALLRRPTLIFEVDDLAAAAAAIAASGAGPAARSLVGPTDALALTAPDGTPIRIVPGR